MKTTIAVLFGIILFAQVSSAQDCISRSNVNGSATIQVLASTNTTIEIAQPPGGYSAWSWIELWDNGITNYYIQIGGEATTNSPEASPGSRFRWNCSENFSEKIGFRSTVTNVGMVKVYWSGGLKK